MADGQINRFDVIGLGCSCIDFLGIVPRLPRLDEEIEMVDSMQQGGGEVATALVTLARLGASTAYIGKVGDDPIGVMIQHDFDHEGVNTDHLIVEPGARSLAAVVLVDQQSGQRSIIAGRRTAGELEAGELHDGLIEQAKYLHLDGTDAQAALVAAKRARKAGVTVVLDADVTALGPHIQQLIEQTDILIASQPFAESHTAGNDPVTAVERMQQAGPATVIVTLGDKGGVGSDGDRTFRYSAFEVDVVDTTGAGDVFHGGFIRGLLEGWPLEQTVRFAAAVAAVKCTKLGGRTGIPDMPTAMSFIDRHGDEFTFDYTTTLSEQRK